MKILFIANGDTNSNINLELFDKICCVDGGLHNLKKIDNAVVPNYIFGDFDSVDTNLLSKYKNKTAIIKKEKQDASDLLFAVEYITKTYKNIEEMVFICVKGNRFDHTICNVLLLSRINCKTKIVTADEEIYLVRKKIELQNVLKKTLSLIPLSNIKNIKTKGLKWELEGCSLDFGYINGISNIAVGNNVEISIDGGILLVCVNQTHCF
jgi:thiamine pyrophosphokinase